MLTIARAGRIISGSNRPVYEVSGLIARTREGKLDAVRELFRVNFAPFHEPRVRAPGLQHCKSGTRGLVAAVRIDYT